MTTPADATADERAFEACLAGRPLPDGAVGLAAFTDAVRAGATEPGRPNAALAELLVTGLLVPTQEPSRGTAGQPARTSRKRPRMLISTLVAKFAAAGAVAKAAAAGGVVAVALTGAATAGALPGQDDTTAVVQSGDAADVTDAPQDTTADDTTPVDGTGGDTTGDETGGDENTGEDGAVGGTTGEEGAGGEVSDVPAPEAPVTEPTRTEDEWVTGPDAGQSFGDWVSEGARNGWSTGERVSDAAHQRNADRRPPATAPTPRSRLPSSRSSSPSPWRRGPRSRSRSRRPPRRPRPTPAVTTTATATATATAVATATAGSRRGSFFR
jgi:hypothetical protein